MQPQWSDQEDAAETDCKPNNLTRRVMVGAIPLGGGSPCAVQSMLNVALDDVGANLAQIEELAEAGCEIIRIAIPHRENLDSFEKICSRSPLPVVADIHFNPEIAIEASRRGAAKLRINPGNIGGSAQTDKVIEAAREAGIPIRIGVNAGSLDTALAKRADLSLPQKLSQSVVDYVRYFQQRDFNEIVVSAKAHDVMATVETYRLLAREIPEVPLHIGITEAGTLLQGVVKSASGLGILLSEGIGDTLRISLTDDPVKEVRTSWMLLAALNLRRRGLEIISCPTCGRCKVDLIALAEQVEARMSHITRPVRIAVMGCVVNGPGEAADADIGVACGVGSGVIFKHGKILRKVNEEDIVDVLMEEIGKL